MIKRLIKFLIRRYLTEENVDKALKVCYEEYAKRTAKKRKK